jgi:hypothetical protein
MIIIFFSFKYLVDFFVGIEEMQLQKSPKVVKGIKPKTIPGDKDKRFNHYFIYTRAGTKSFSAIMLNSVS